MLFRFAAVLIGIFAIASPVLAARVEMSREVAQGEFFAVKISEAMPELEYWVSFRGKTYKAERLDDETRMALVPVEIDYKSCGGPRGVKAGEKLCDESVVVEGKKGRERLEISPPIEVSITKVIFPEYKPVVVQEALKAPELKRNAQEEKLVQSVYGAECTPPQWGGEVLLSSPLAEEARISSEFGTARRVRIRGQKRIRPVRHWGTDFAVPALTRVFAAGAGTVRLAEDLLLSGNTVIIDHGGCLFSAYFHLSQILVEKEAKVSMGQPIGLSGETGRSRGAHLHFEKRIRSLPVNPRAFIGVNETAQGVWEMIKLGSLPVVLPPEVILAKSAQARSLLSQEAPQLHRQKRGARQVVVGRDILLAVYSSSRDAIEVVRLVAHVPQPRNRFIFSVATPGFRVEWIRGRGVVHLAFRVTDSWGEELTLLDSRHVLAPGGNWSDVYYFPYTDVLQQKFFAEGGSDFFLSKIAEAKEELCGLRVKSQAFPGKLVCEVFPDELLFSIALIEQIDDREFGGACPADNCREYAVDKALVHLALNRENAFRYNVSRTGARGIMQFMNTRRIPTYRSMVRRYPEARLIEDYLSGTADIKNSLKAALCLLDWHLSILPQGVRDIFLENPRRGGIFSLVSYNAGPDDAQRLYNVFERQRLSLDDVEILRRVLKRETFGYITKYRGVWEIIERLMAP